MDNKIKKTIYAIGGGELKTKTTLGIDEIIACDAKLHAGNKRAYGLFLGTASHDSMPYFNSFRKTYTANFDIKADCALTVYGEMNLEKIKEKFEKADLVYIGGGNTVYMIEQFKKSGLYELVLDAYNRGVIIAGLSAGAIFWFNDMYTDSVDKAEIENSSYTFHNGIGVLDGVCTPHYNLRKEDFSKAFLESEHNFSYAIEDNSALKFVDGKLMGSICCGGSAYIVRKNVNTLENYKISEIIK